ncbi:MAG TPA: pilus assembly protein PilP [Rhodocyclaceae bacterium]|nr:pilus assembly protein PilP [Rhodocyclaceae bacterium]
MSRLALLLSVILSLLLAGCGGGTHEDLKLWMKDATKNLKGHVPPLPEIKPFPVVSYDAGDALDPFKPFGNELEKKLNGGGLKPDFKRPKEPLESYPLESLKMVGVLQQGKVRQAVIRTGTRVYLVKVGNHLGQNFGVITDITDHEVRIKELVQDPSGDWVEHASTLELQEQETKK